jgi:hypothetical protein
MLPYRATNPTKTPMAYWGAGIMGKWSNLATHSPVRRSKCRILEQKQMKETIRQSRFRIGTSLALLASVQNPAQSCLIVPNRDWSVAAFVRKRQMGPVAPALHSPGQSSLIKANQGISCLDTIQSQPPSCTKIATSPTLLRQIPVCRAVSSRCSPAKAESKRRRVKPGQTRSNHFPNSDVEHGFPLAPPYVVYFVAHYTTNCSQSVRRTPPQPNNPKSLRAGSRSGLEAAIRNPQFHLVPLNST